MKIALLQYPIAWADKETNLRYAEERIAALAGKADVAVLPEMFATGFCTDHPELAETMDGDIIRRLQTLANQTGVAIVSSFICSPIANSEASNTRAKLTNRGFMIKPIGGTPSNSVASNTQYPIGGTPSNSVASIEVQDKRHLYAHGGEDLFFQPAQERCIFEYKGVKILLLVCYDLRFPVWARNQSGSDYDIILVVANWPDIRIQYWDALIAARATENQCYIAAVNCVGDDGMGLHYNGHSVAYDTRLQPIVSFANDEEGTKIADFDIEKLHHFREVLPLWKDVDKFELQQ
jgi:predicted amidohydrolase